MKLEEFNRKKKDLTDKLEVYREYQEQLHARAFPATLGSNKTKSEKPTAVLRYLPMHIDFINRWAGDMVIGPVACNYSFLTSKKLDPNLYEYMKGYYRSDAIRSSEIGNINSSKVAHVTKRSVEWGLEMLMRHFNKVECALDKVIAINTDIEKSMTETNAELVRGATLKSVKIGEEATIKVKFRLDETVINRHNDLRLFGVTDYEVIFAYSQEDNKYYYEYIYGRSVDDVSINPHIAGGGDRGTVCLGSYDYAFAQSISKGNWFEVVYTLLEFNRQVNMQDTWGRRIRDAARVWKSARGGDMVTNSSRAASAHGYKNLTTDYAAAYTRGKTAYLMEDYVICSVTNKIIPRDMAVRLPIYVSETTIRCNQVPYSLARFYKTNRTDIVKLEKAKKEITAKYNKRNMSRFHQEALDNEAIQVSIALRNANRRLSNG